MLMEEELAEILFSSWKKVKMAAGCRVHIPSHARKSGEDVLRVEWDGLSDNAKNFDRDIARLVLVYLTKKKQQKPS